jgi:hypothetical protein
MLAESFAYALGFNFCSVAYLANSIGEEITVKNATIRLDHQETPANAASV